MVTSPESPKTNLHLGLLRHKLSALRPSVARAGALIPENASIAIKDILKLVIKVCIHFIT
jgi:hypothetical protein